MLTREFRVFFLLGGGRGILLFFFQYGLCVFVSDTNYSFSYLNCPVLVSGTLPIGSLPSSSAGSF